MASIYDGITTARDLIRNVQMHGFSTKTEDINRAADIIGHEPIENLVFLANHIGRKNENGVDDPNGSLSGGSPATRDTFYSVLFRVWGWEDAARFWNEHTNPERKVLLDAIRYQSKNEEQKEDNRALVERLNQKSSENHDLLTQNLNLAEELRDANDTIICLKAKLYDLMVAKEEK